MKKLSTFILILSAFIFLFSNVYAEDPVKIKVKVMQTKANGKPWDLFGNPPDIMIKISHEKIDELSSRIFKNTYTAQAVFYLDELSEDEEFTIEVWDIDIRNHDLIGEGSISKKTKKMRIGRCTITLK